MAKATARSKGSKRQRPGPSVTKAPLAMTSNGLLLINVLECEGRDLKDRERFVGVAATPEEARSIYRATEDAFCAAASKLAANLPLAKPTRRSSRRTKATTS